MERSGKGGKLRRRSKVIINLATEEFRTKDFKLVLRAKELGIILHFAK